MFHYRGGIEDVAAWEKLGNPGWDWDSNWPYYEKSENFTRPKESVAREYNISYESGIHGYEGLIKASYGPLSILLLVSGAF